MTDDQFRVQFRMTASSFEKLLCVVAPFWPQLNGVSVDKCLLLFLYYIWYTRSQAGNKYISILSVSVTVLHAVCRRELFESVLFPFLWKGDRDVQQHDRRTTFGSLHRDRWLSRGATAAIAIVQNLITTIKVFILLNSKPAWMPVISLSILT